MQKQIASSKFKIAFAVVVTVIFMVAIMAISVGVNGNTSVYADGVSIVINDASTTYSSLEAVFPASYVAVYGTDSDVVLSYYSADDVDMVTEVTPKNAGTYIVKAECDDVIETAYFTINPATVNITLSGSYDPVYSGVGYTKTVTRTGVFQSDIDNNTFELVVSYIKEGSSVKLTEAVDAGLYYIDIELYNPTIGEASTDYVLGTISGGDSVSIQQKDLQISLKSIIIDIGEEPTAEYSYSGFIAGQDESVLSSLPSIAFSETDSGVYSVTPYGASAVNYNISYKAGTITINEDTVSITCEGIGDITLKGAFDPSASITASDMTEDEAYFDTIYSILKLNNAVSSELSISTIIKVTADAQANQGDYVKYIISGIDNVWYAKTKVGVVNVNGEFQEIGSASIDDGVLTLTSNTLGDIVVYQDYSATLIILGCIVMFIFVVATYLIVCKVNYNKKLKQRKEEPQKVVKRETTYKW